MSGLPLISNAIVKFFSQRIDGKPFVNCLPYSLCPVLRWMKYDVPDTYGMALRKASGVWPVQAGVGTSFQNMQDALVAILPNAPVIFAGLSDAALLDTLPRLGKRNKGRAVVSLIARMELLPHELRRHVGFHWEGLHAITVGGYDFRNGEDYVYWMDPMGKTWEGYTGEWVPYRFVQHTLYRSSRGMIRTIRGLKGTAA